MAAQARARGTGGLEKALALSIESDLALRSSRPTPARALVERLLVRIAMLRRAA
jgi:DNA polymerase-3 subunit delta